MAHVQVWPNFIDNPAPEPKRPEVEKYRFHCHIWSADFGHKDKRYLITGTCVEDAYINLAARLRDAFPDIKVNVKWYEKVGA